jgi:hypothetical protein
MSAITPFACGAIFAKYSAECTDTLTILEWRAISQYWRMAMASSGGRLSRERRYLWRALRFNPLNLIYDFDAICDAVDVLAIQLEILTETSVLAYSAYALCADVACIDYMSATGMPATHHNRAAVALLILAI